MVSTVPSGLVMITSYSGWCRDAWIDGVNHKFTMKVWPTPTGLGLKLRCATGEIVTVGVAPAGRGPGTATSAAANTGKVKIPTAEASNRITVAIAVAIVLFFNICIFFLLRFFAKLGKSFVEGPYLLCSVLKLCQNQSTNTKKLHRGECVCAELLLSKPHRKKQGSLNLRFVSCVRRLLRVCFW